MAVTIKGFQGTVSDLDMATQLGAHHGPTVRSAADLAVTAVANARQVSVAAGVSDHAFVKYASDAAQTLTLPAPNSGGLWYLVAVNRQWSPGNSAVLEAISTGSTTDGTVPTTVPLAVVQAAQSVLRTAPGTGSNATPPASGYGAHAPLALVHVRAADTTLTLFDVRLRRTGAGVLLAPNLWALVAAYIWGHIISGAVVPVDGYTIPGGGYHERSTWQLRYDGRLVPLGRMEGNDGGASYFRNHVQAVVAAYSSQMAVPDRSELLSSAAALIWNWSGDDGMFVPRPQPLVLKRWAQWNYGPAPRGDWFDPPLDTWWDPFGIANYGNGITLPATGRYRVFGRWSYQQASAAGERIMVALLNATTNKDTWSGLPSQMFQDTGYPFEIYFEGLRTQQVKLRVYHAAQSDYYMTAGASGNTEGPNVCQAIFEYLGR